MDFLFDTRNVFSFVQPSSAGSNNPPIGPSNDPAHGTPQSHSGDLGEPGSSLCICLFGW